MEDQIQPRIYSIEEVRNRVRDLGDWFHNLNLQGVQTAPNHFLGDYPEIKWRNFANAIPSDLRGKTVLDIGCNAGFYSIQMKRRGAARVLGVDFEWSSRSSSEPPTGRGSSWAPQSWAPQSWSPT